MVLEILDVGVPRNKPEQLVDNGFQMHFLRGQKRKALGKVETHLMSEDALCAHPGAVVFHHSGLTYQFQKVEILLHSYLTENAKIIACS